MSCGEIAPAGAEIARGVEAFERMIGIEDQDAVLEQADEIVAEVELEQAVAEERVLDGCPELPGALRLQSALPPLTRCVDRSATLMKS